MSIITRIKALAFVLLLTGSITLSCIGVLGAIEPSFTNGARAEHVDGKITRLKNGMDFVFQTSSGRVMQFQCNKACRATLGHLRRHMNEHAHTDVFYVEGPNNSLLAIDVD